MDIFCPRYISHIIALDIIVFLLWTMTWLVKAIFKKETINNNIETLLIAIAFANLGLIFGIFTGLSSSPVVGVLITSFIALFGSLITYFSLKDKENSRQSFHVALLGILIIPVTLLFGLEIGGKDRFEYEKKIDQKDILKEKAMLEMKKIIGVKIDSTQFIPVESLPEVK